VKNIGQWFKATDQCLSGRPKGSTVQAAVDLKKRIELAMYDAVVSLSEAVSKKKKGERLKKGALT
jgi:hypothetical protein